VSAVVFAGGSPPLSLPIAGSLVSSPPLSLTTEGSSVVSYVISFWLTPF